MRRFVGTIILAAVGLATCSPRAPASSSIAPSGIPVATSAPATPGVSAAGLPEEIDQISWASLEYTSDPNDNPTGAVFTAGFLGGDAAFRRETPSADDARIAANGDLVALSLVEGDRTKVDIHRIRSGARVASLELHSAEDLRIDSPSGRLYWIENLGEGIGKQVHRGALDGTDTVTLLELGPAHASGGDLDPGNRFDYAIATDGTFVAAVCERERGCSVYRARPDAPAELIAVAPVVSSFCSLVGTTSTLIVVTDGAACDAMDETVPIPVWAINIANGAAHLVQEGPNFEPSRVLELSGVAHVLARQRIQDIAHGRLVLVDATTGDKRILIESLPVIPGSDDDPSSYVPSTIGLPEGWILLVPRRFGSMSNEGLPAARLINIIDNRQINIPMMPGY